MQKEPIMTSGLSGDDNEAPKDFLVQPRPRFIEPMLIKPRLAWAVAFCLLVGSLAYLPAANARQDGNDRDEHHDGNGGKPAGLKAEVAALVKEVAELRRAVTSLKAKLENVSLETVNGQPTVRFTGVNVQVVNGSGRTDSANGTGNFIVGYDEPDTSPQFGAFIPRCTIGTGRIVIPPSPEEHRPDPSTIEFPVTNQDECAQAGGQWVTEGFKTGSHYLVLGIGNNYSRWGAMVAGFENTSNFDWATVSGGFRNTASGFAASVSGGQNNTASRMVSSVSGGRHNKASGSQASVSGGANNTASGTESSITAGDSNNALDIGSSVTGGSNNIAGGTGLSSRQTVSGGRFCTEIRGDGWSVGSSGGTATGCTAMNP